MQMQRKGVSACERASRLQLRAGSKRKRFFSCQDDVLSRFGLHYGTVSTAGCDHSKQSDYNNIHPGAGVIENYAVYAAERGRA